MKSILVTNQKGGCGKTTITISLARDLELRGFKVAILDTDYQKSVTEFFNIMDIETDIDNFTGYRDFKNDFKDYDYVIIDTSPVLDQRIIDLIVLADFILIPITASQLDFLATDRMLATLETIKKDKRKKTNFNCGFVFNNCTNQAVLNELRSVLLDEDILVLQTLPKRVAFTLSSSATVFERKNKLAINDMKYLTDVILEKI